MDVEPTCSTTNGLPPHFWWRILLLCCLVPMAVAAFFLAQVPIASLFGTHDISEDGRFVLTGYLDDEGMDYRLLSLQHDKTIRFQGLSAEISHGNVYWYEPIGDQIRGKRLDLESLNVIDLGSFDARLIWKKQNGAYFRSASSLIHPGIMAVMNSNNDLCILDFQTENMSSVSVVGSSYAWYPVWCGSSQRLLLVEISNGATKGNDRILLFSLVNGKVERLAEWNTTQVPIVVDGRILSLTSDIQLEIRQLSDGTLIQRQPLAAALNAKAPITTRPLSVFLGARDSSNQGGTSAESGLLQVVVRPNRHMLYDYLEQQVKWERSSPNIRCADIRFGKISYTSNQFADVARLDDGTSLMHVEFPTWVFAARFIGNGEQLLVLLQDESVHICDVASGKIMQTFRSQRWVAPTLIALVAGFAGWCCLWVRHSTQTGIPPLFDVTFLSALLLTGLLLRLFLVGGLRNPDRLIYQFLELLGVSWLILLSLWFVFGRARWSVKVIGPLLGLAGAVSIALLVFHGARQALWEFLVAMSGITATVIATFGVTRKLGWRLVNPSDVHQPLDRKLENRVPLRDLFVVFIVAGLLFAVLRLIPAGVYDRRSLEMLTILLAMVAISAVGGVWPALSPCHWLLRVIGFGVLVTSAVSVYAIFNSGLRNWQAWPEQLRYAGLISGFTCALLLIFRVRGWRLSRVRHAAA